MENNIVTMAAGNIEYDIEAARLSIDELIEALEDAKSLGAEYVVGLSGNYRGAKYARLSAELEFEEED